MESLLIESVEFRNFKALRKAVLPLGPFTLIIGPNGSGKSTVLQALQAAAESANLSFKDVVSAGTSGPVSIIIRWQHPEGVRTTRVRTIRGS
jgi:predicted ATPase